MATTVQPFAVIEGRSDEEAGNKEPMEIDEYVTETEYIPYKQLEHSEGSESDSDEEEGVDSVHKISMSKCYLSNQLTVNINFAMCFKLRPSSYSEL